MKKIREVKDVELEKVIGGSLVGMKIIGPKQMGPDGMTGSGETGVLLVIRIIIQPIRQIKQSIHFS